MPKQRSYTVAYKLEVLKWHKDHGSNVSQTARNFSIDRKRVREWNDQEDTLLMNSTGKDAKRRRIGGGAAPQNEELDNKVLDYLLDERAAGRAVSNKDLMAKARELARGMDNMEQFLASDGWLQRWKKRHCVELAVSDNVTSTDPIEQTDGGNNTQEGESPQAAEVMDTSDTVAQTETLDQLEVITSTESTMDTASLATPSQAAEVQQSTEGPAESPDDRDEVQDPAVEATSGAQTVDSLEAEPMDVSVVTPQGVSEPIDASTEVQVSGTEVGEELKETSAKESASAEISDELESVPLEPESTSEPVLEPDAEVQQTPSTESHEKLASPPPAAVEVADDVTPSTHEKPSTPDETTPGDSLDNVKLLSPVTIEPDSEDFIARPDPSTDSSLPIIIGEPQTVESMDSTESSDRIPEVTVIQPDDSVLEEQLKQPSPPAPVSILARSLTTGVPSSTDAPPSKASSKDTSQSTGDAAAKEASKQTAAKDTAGKETGSTSKGVPQKKDEKKSKPKQTCVVCGKVTKCKYNIVRNGDIKHLCDDSCFKIFRANPTQFLKKTATPVAAADSTPTISPPKSTPATSPPANTPPANTPSANTPPKSPAKSPSKGTRTCDNCSKNCIEAEMHSHGRRRFCSFNCKMTYKNEKCCFHCSKDMSGLKEFTRMNIPNTGERLMCSSICKSKYEVEAKRRKAAAHATKVVSNKGGGADDDVQIVSASIPSYKSHATRGGLPGTRNTRNFACAMCTKVRPVKHEVSLDSRMHKLCSDVCFSKFRVSNKLSLRDCATCGAHMMTVEGQLGHSLQSEGKTIPFCGASCMNKYKVKNASMVACQWCHIKRNKFTMVENKGTNGKYAMFCTLNCLSLYRVNAQATSNNSVKCNQCGKMAPAQYHLTMSDASVRNFCSYTCVMAFQSKFTMPGGGGGSGGGQQQATPQGTQHRNTASKQASPPASRRSGRVASKGAVGAGGDMPLISNVVSLATNTQAPTPTPTPKGRPMLQQTTPQRSTPSPAASGPPQGQKATKHTSPMKQQIVVQPPAAKTVKNKSLMCKPYVATKATSCKPHTQSKSCQTDPVELEQTKIPVPVPVPIYVPVPMGMYNFPVPYPVPLPIPLPVPCFIPTTKKNSHKILKHIQDIMNRIPSDPLEAELLAMAEAVAQPPKDSDSDSNNDDDDAPEDDMDDFTAPVDSEPAPSAEVEEFLKSLEDPSGGGELGEDMLQMALRMASEIPDGQVLDLETSLHPTPINPEPSSNSATFTDNSSSDVLSRDTSPSPPPAASRRGRKRRGGGGGSTGATPRRNTKRSRKDDSLPQELTVQTSTPVGGAPILSSPPAQPPPDANFVLKFTYGVNAFRHWVAQKNTALEQAGKKHKPFRSDLLAATADELNTALTLFVREVRKPNGEVYAPDSIFYLCLGIQQYLFENNRIDNIFTDIYFEQFTDKLNNVLHNYEVRLNQQGLIVCRIEEEHLWEAKLLGAHSPHVLLHSLIYFNAKFFMLRTAEEHLALSAACISKHWRKIGVLSKPARQMYLRYCPPVDASKRARMKEEPPSFEQLENTENPLRCPVKLYEFFLSKCPESVRSRNDGFYLVPESSCVPDSPVWYSTAPLGAEAMTKMLNRVRVVKEIQEAHLHYQPGY